MYKPPKKDISDHDWEKIELYLKAGVKPWKVATLFHVSNADFRKKIESQYRKPCDEVLDRFKNLGETLLEVTQFQKAISGNIAMLMYLGRIRLGQVEPAATPATPPAQAEIDKDHLIMQLKHELAQLKEKLVADADKPEAR